MKLMVLTAACWPTEEEARRRIWIFLRSCERFGVTPDVLRLYGIGTPQFLGYIGMKLNAQLDFLRNHSEDFTHVLYTDSLDAFFCGPLQEIINKYTFIGKPPILSSAFFQLGNVSDENLQYPRCFDHSKYYCFPNVGGYIAEIPVMVDMFERMLKLPRQTGDDCFSWYDAWQEGWFRPELDSDCQIFHISDSSLTSDIDEHGIRRLVNSRTKTEPCIAHFSGGFTSQTDGKDDTLKPWARLAGVID